MWHESSEEIKVCLKSLFKMDEDYCVRKLRDKVYDQFEWEGHVFFDDCMKKLEDKWKSHLKDGKSEDTNLKKADQGINNNQDKNRKKEEKANNRRHDAYAAHCQHASALCRARAHAKDELVDQTSRAPVRRLPRGSMAFSVNSSSVAKGRSSVAASALRGSSAQRCIWQP